MKELTSEEMLSCNGKDGKPVYIAFEGKVYDVSKSRLWSTGLHMNRHPCGKDLTSEISAAPHGTEVFDRYPQVGILKKEAPEEPGLLPPFLESLLETFPIARRHPHPVLVHYPIAFLSGAALFIVLYLFSGNPSFEVTSFYLMLLGSIASPFAMGTGLLTWWINYRLKLTHFIRRKIQLSILLILLEAVLIVWRLSATGRPLTYCVLLMLLAPVVFLLGYYGGQMTFPIEKKR